VLTLTQLWASWGPVVLPAEETGGISALGIHLPSLVVYTVNFLILVGILYAFAYRPVLRMLDARQERIRESLERANRVAEEARQAQAEMERRLEEARQESQRMLEEARQMAERYREEERARARQEAEAYLARAREEIARERDSALEELRRHFAELALRAAERIVERSLDPSAHRDIIERVLEEGSAQFRKG